MAVFTCRRFSTTSPTTAAQLQRRMQIGGMLEYNTFPVIVCGILILPLSPQFYHPVTQFTYKPVLDQAPPNRKSQLRQ